MLPAESEGATTQAEGASQVQPHRIDRNTRRIQGQKTHGCVAVVDIGFGLKGLEEDVKLVGDARVGPLALGRQGELGALAQA